jgi:hypothetical protein
MTQQTTEQFQFKLTPKDLNILHRFKVWFVVSKKASFTTDDLWAYGLVTQFFKDSVHDVGSWTAKMVRHHYFKEIARVPSDRPSAHRRKIALFQPTDKFWGFQQT